MSFLVAVLECYGNGERSEDALCSLCATLAVAESSGLVVDPGAVVLAEPGASVPKCVNVRIARSPRLGDLSAAV